MSAKRVFDIDNVPYRLNFAAEKSGIDTINFSEVKDVVKRLQEVVPGGIDVGLHCGMCFSLKQTIALLLMDHLGHLPPRAQDDAAQDREGTHARAGREEA